MLIAWISAGLILVTSVGLLISRDWRVSLGLLAAQYVCVFGLIGQSWPWSMAAIKLITGWMAVATLGITRQRASEVDESADEFWSQGRLFRIFAAGVIATTTIAGTIRVDDIIPGIGLPILGSGLMLVGMGLLHLGTTSRTLRGILGLLTVLSGFETIYAALESSILVTAMLAAITLGLALVGSFFLASQQPEAAE
ncbi:MAG: hypothetical protein Kow002_09820 [Anaerolineales bacterium]